MKKLKELVSLCRGSVTIEINEHTSDYRSVEDFLSVMEGIDEIPEDVLDKMIDLDTIVYVHAYPNSPIGFLNIYHYDVDIALDEIIKTIKNENIQKDN